MVPFLLETAPALSIPRHAPFTPGRCPGDQKRHQVPRFDSTEREINSLSRTVIADKGYHADQVFDSCAKIGAVTCIAVPEVKQRRNWANQLKSTRARWTANRRRARSRYGRRLLRRRSATVERSFAHICTRDMRRTWVRGRENVEKRYLIIGAAFNLGVMMRSLVGAGTPKALAGLLDLWISALEAMVSLLRPPRRPARSTVDHILSTPSRFVPQSPRGGRGRNTQSSTAS
jgi:hypothetical protein